LKNYEQRALSQNLLVLVKKYTGNCTLVSQVFAITLTCILVNDLNFHNLKDSGIDADAYIAQ